MSPTALLLLVVLAGAAAPDGAAIRAHVGHLASNEMKGRNAGEPGSEKAAKYIAAHFEELGLEAIGDDGTYFQRFEFDVRGTDGKATTPNVVALLRGSDEKLCDEVIVVGAHYDHVGQVGEPDSGRIGSAKDGDSIWNGADDNASGTSAVMEAARLLATADPGPSRSVLFILFGAEEHGLLGSRHYVSDPILPLEKTVGMINMDMVGRNPDEPISVSGTGSAEVFADLLDQAQRDQPDLRLNRMGITLPGGSDHLSFIMGRVPALFVSTGLHEDYHRVTDHADRISYEQIERVTGMAVSLVRGLGEGERATFSLQTANPFPTLGRLAMRQLKAPLFLGISGLEDVDQGVKVGRVLPLTRGAAAGLERGDVIRTVNGEAVGDDPTAALRKALRGADRFATTTLGVLRGDEEVEVIVVWRG